MTYNKSNGLFVTDLDGTLLTDDKDILQVDLENLIKLRESGFAVSLATGRSLFSFNRFLDEKQSLKEKLLAGVDYVIFSTGAGLLHVESGQMLRTHTLSVEDVIEITTLLEQKQVNYMIHAPIPDTQNFYYRQVNGGCADFHRRIKMYADYGRDYSGVAREALNEFAGATEILCIEECSRGHLLAEEIAARLKRFSVIKATSPLDHESVWIEIFSHSVSKSSAVKWLAGELALSSNEVCGVGNDYNDQDMLQWVGKAYMVENGPACLKQEFISVTSNNRGGVSAAIEHWLNS